jgi:hypothetical protein
MFDVEWNNGLYFGKCRPNIYAFPKFLCLIQLSNEISYLLPKTFALFSSKPPLRQTQAVDWICENPTNLICLTCKQFAPIGQYPISFLSCPQIVSRVVEIPSCNRSNWSRQARHLLRRHTHRSKKFKALVTEMSDCLRDFPPLQLLCRHCENKRAKSLSVEQVGIF